MPGIPARTDHRRRSARSPPARAGSDGQLYRARRRDRAVPRRRRRHEPGVAAKLAAHDTFDNNGRVYQVAGSSQAPGALPRTPNPPAVTAQPAPASQPLVMASVPMPQPAPRAKEGEAPPAQPKSIAGLLGNIFGGSPAEARPTKPEERQTVTLRGSNTEMAAKP